MYKSPATEGTTNQWNKKANTKIELLGRENEKINVREKEGK